MPTPIAIRAAFGDNYFAAKIWARFDLPWAALLQENKKLVPDLAGVKA